MTPADPPPISRAANVSLMQITHRGQTQIPMTNKTLVLSDVVPSPQLTSNLVSVHSVAKDHGGVLFEADRAFASTTVANSTLKSLRGPLLATGATA